MLKITVQVRNHKPLGPTLPLSALAQVKFMVGGRTAAFYAWARGGSVNGTGELSRVFNNKEVNWLHTQCTQKRSCSMLDATALVISWQAFGQMDSRFLPRM